jgi:acetyltransferase-like isoleucine patch superfamily enzyme
MFRLIKRKFQRIAGVLSGVKQTFQDKIFLLSFCRKFNKANIDIYPSKLIEKGAVIKIVGGGSIKIGKQFRMRAPAQILSYKGQIRIGDNCSLNQFSVVFGLGGLTIGNGVRIGTHTVIIPSNHNFDRTDIPIFKQGETMNGIVIEDDVWIGANCTICDGVVIGEGTVIGAGSVVTRSISPFSVAFGSPARVRRSRSEKQCSNFLH